MSEPADQGTGAGPVIGFEGLVNARDVGPLPTADGGCVRSGRLYRSETPQLMTDADVARAVDVLGVRRVIDLRGRRGGGSGRLGRNGRGVVLDFFELAGGAGAHLDLSAEGFLAAQLDLAGPVVGAVLAEIDATPEGAVLVHCHTGKDRTGFVIAVILAALGVADDDIVADYERSRPVFATLMGNLTVAGLAVADDAPEYARHEPSTAGLRAMLDRLRSGWADTTAYLRDAGVDPSLVERVRDRLVEPAGGDAGLCEDRRPGRGRTDADHRP